MHTTTLTTENRAQEMCAEARVLRARLATKLGLALLEWSHRHDERRTAHAVSAHRETQRLAQESLAREFARVATSVTAR